MRFLLAVCVALPVATVAATDEPADRVGSVVDRYVNNDTLAVAALQINGQWARGMQQDLAARMGDQAGLVVSHPGFALGVGIAETLRTAGAREAVLIAGVHDLTPQTGPLLVLTVDKPDRAAPLGQAVTAWTTPGLNPMKGIGTRVVDDLVLIGQQATIEHYVQLEPAERPELDVREPIRQADDGSGPWAVMVAAAGGDTRRVIEALWPTLPEPFTAADGSFVANDIQQFAAMVNSPPDWQIRLSITADNESAAAKVQSLIEKAWDQAVSSAEQNANQPELADITKAAADLLTPRLEGNTVSVQVGHDDAVVNDLASRVIAPTVKDLQHKARLRPRLMQMKQLALAMLNFESAVGHYPASAAIVDGDGKPLLSWRVAILPFVEESTLHDKFRLDEPWDSPHNLELQKQMPDVFASHSAPDLAREGLTTYQVPVNQRSVFPPSSSIRDFEKRSWLGSDVTLAKGTSLRDIIDGTSATLLIVEVPREEAVIWTKPADWEVDLAKAWQQLTGGATEGSAVAAYCDGSARVWYFSDDGLDQTLPKLITRDGKEIIPR